MQHFFPFLSFPPTLPVFRPSQAKDTADVASLDESLRLYREGLEGLVAGAKTDQDARRQHAVKKRAAQWLYVYYY